tara:strand:+ start:1336 stop:1548 length:213 start_codon:yes stop_codon:yes gene_type:complete
MMTAKIPQPLEIAPDEVALLALAIRKDYVQCPICDAMIGDGMPHYARCIVYGVELSTEEIWRKYTHLTKV